MKTNTYNGWTNYETWQAALWLDQYGYYSLQLDRWEDDGEMPQLDSDDVHTFIEEIVLDKAPEGMLVFDSLFGDIVSGWMSSVNWSEIANKYNADLEREQC